MRIIGFSHGLSGVTLFDMWTLCYFIAGLLHTGDTILEVNGKEVKTPDELKNMLKQPSDSVTLKVIPNKQTPISPDAVSCCSAT